MRTMHQDIRRRRGVASMMAMIYLVLFAVLAVGFYASTTVTMQISANEQRGVQALLAAETGMAFVRNALHQVVVPPNASNAQYLLEVCGDLEELLNDTGNLGSNRVDLNGGTIEVPHGKNNYITAGNGMKFRADISSEIGADNAQLLVVKVIGAADTAGGYDRAGIEMKYRREERPTSFFDYGMASRGGVNILTGNWINGDPVQQASIMSFSTVNPPVSIGSGSTAGKIDGDIYVPTGTTPNVVAGSSVGGTTIHADIMDNHVHPFDADDVPSMPVPDTNVYKKFAVNKYVPGSTEYANIYIPPNANPTFNGTVTLYGVILIQQPNKVAFNGKVDIQGVIVSDNSGVGTLLTNTITFSGLGGTKKGLESLPEDDDRFPQELRDLAGVFVVAPGFDVQFTGNFGAVGGHIAGDRVTLSGSSSATIEGSVMSLKSNLTLSGNTQVTFKPGAGGHTGLRFDDRFIPAVESYREIRP